VSYETRLMNGNDGGYVWPVAGSIPAHRSYKQIDGLVHAIP